MGLEVVTNISDLVRTNPTSSDPKSAGDDHIRNLKTALLNDLVGFPGAIMVTGTDGGAVNAYTLTPAYGTFIAYGNRMVAVFSPTITNTGASTLNISGLGAKDVKSVDGVALVANDLLAGSIYAAFYNGTEFRLLSITKNYADQLSFSAALPAQTGNSGKFLTTDGSAASWSALLKAGTMRWADSTDTTKLLAFSVSGVTTATTRTGTVPDRDFKLGGLSNIVVLTTTQSWQPPTGVTRVRRIIVDGGYSGGTSAGGQSQGGQGGNGSIGWITVDPAVTYTATVGAGGVAAGAGTTTAPAAGGASSLSGTGLTTQTSANGDAIIPGGAAPARGVIGGAATFMGGSSIMACNSLVAGTGYGGGGAGANTGAAGNNGATGAVIIEY